MLYSELVGIGGIGKENKARLAFLGSKEINVGPL
jgi:hypothetical protein